MQDIFKAFLKNNNKKILEMIKRKEKTLIEWDF